MKFDEVELRSPSFDRFPLYYTSIFMTLQPLRSGYHEIKVKYIDLARAKSEALVNNTCKQKKLNRVTLNEGRQCNGFKTNRSN